MTSDVSQSDLGERYDTNYMIFGLLQIGKSHLHTTGEFSLTSLTSQFFLGNGWYISAVSQMGHSALGTR